VGISACSPAIITPSLMMSGRDMPPICHEGGVVPPHVFHIALPHLPHVDSSSWCGGDNFILTSSPHRPSCTPTPHFDCSLAATLWWYVVVLMTPTPGLPQTDRTAPPAVWATVMPLARDLFSHYGGDQTDTGDAVTVTHSDGWPHLSHSLKGAYL